MSKIDKNAICPQCKQKGSIQNKIRKGKTKRKCLACGFRLEK